MRPTIEMNQKPLNIRSPGSTPLRVFGRFAKPPKATETISKELRQYFLNSKEKHRPPSLEKRSFEVENTNRVLHFAQNSDYSLENETNVGLRTIVKELQNKIRSIENERVAEKQMKVSELTKEIQNLKTRNSDLEIQLSIAENKLKNISSFQNVKKEFEPDHSEVLIDLTAKVSRLETNLHLADDTIASLQRERNQLVKQLEFYTLSSANIDQQRDARDSSFFITKSDLITEANHLREENAIWKEKAYLLEQVLQVETQHKNEQIAKLELQISRPTQSTFEGLHLPFVSPRRNHPSDNILSPADKEQSYLATERLENELPYSRITFANPRKRDSIAGVQSYIEPQGLTPDDLESLRAENKALKESIATVSLIREQNDRELMRLQSKIQENEKEEILGTL